MYFTGYKMMLGLKNSVWINQSRLLTYPSLQMLSIFMVRTFEIYSQQFSDVPYYNQHCSVELKYFSWLRFCALWPSSLCSSHRLSHVIVILLSSVVCQVDLSENTQYSSARPTSLNIMSFRFIHTVTEDSISIFKVKYYSVCVNFFILFKD